MPQLEVSGATLYYEIVGSGPILLCISGANGSKEAWHPLAEHLKTHFTVVSYDRRGFSRSYLSATEGQDYSRRLATDADDARDLIKHLSTDNQPATVLGSSSGAIVALELLSRHPLVVRTLIPHEPPALQLLEDFPDLSRQQHALYDKYRASGVPPAIDMFMDLVKAGHEAAGFQSAFDPRNGPHISSNTIYWFEREVLAYPFREFEKDLGPEGSLRKHQDRLLLANGEMSNKDALQYRANIKLKEQLGLNDDVVHFSGAHMGYVTHAEAFARELLGFLKSKDAFYKSL